ncbi:hypothetical protein GCM10008023_41040 [Sphingomonas glacialis]|uniref:DUF3455 domain-containing protein n=2 Tax=Sphingomonas glacialis TaxID=658225 RepID=A0ABQ3LX85_9SPHN|nr:hypothetical protein GCM10008023_41040 [Sphingomonas glacialis]
MKRPVVDITPLCKLVQMKVLLPLALLTVGAAPVDHPRSYLLSIGQIPLKDTESIEAFAIETWGLQFQSICHIPSGWRIKAGSSATPNGVIEGNGSQGATWFNHGSPKELRAFVLVTLYAPVQRVDIGSPGNGIPATFKGTATISTDDGDLQRALSYRNITLTPARHCPSG